MTGEKLFLLRITYERRNRKVKEKFILRKCLSLFVVVLLVFGSIPAYAAQESGVIRTSKTKTEGDITTTTVTKKQSGAGYTDLVITDYIKNNKTNEESKVENGTYDNTAKGILVNYSRKRIGEEGVHQFVSSAVGTLNPLAAIRKNTKDITVKDEDLATLLEALNVPLYEMREDEITSTGVEIDLTSSESEEMTVRVPKQIFRSILEKKNPYFKVKTAAASASFDAKAMTRFMEGGGYTVSFSISQWDEGHFTQVEVNNGDDIIDLNGGEATLGITYATGFGVDDERISVYSEDKGAAKKTVIRDIFYDSDNHQVNFRADQLRVFEVVSSDVLFGDISSHWAKKAVERWSNIGVVKGFEGKFQPNAEIKRGDMAVILGNLMGYRTKSQNKFSDLKEGAYYTDAVLEANAAGIMSGSANKVRPEEKITREEAAVMLCKALEISPQETGKTTFKDQDQISAWARGAVNAFVNKGLMSGFEGKINAKNKITRAEVVTILDKALPALVNYGEYSENVSGMLLVNGGDTYLKDLKVDGDLLISDGVGEHDVTLENVTVTGKTIIRGGGEASVHIAGKSNIKTVEMKKVSGPVHLAAEDSAIIETLYVKDGKDKVSLSGTFKKVVLDHSTAVRFEKAEAEAVELNAQEAKANVDASSHIKNMVLTKSAQKSKLDISGEVLAMTIGAKDVLVEGTGKLDLVTVAASDVTVKTNGTEIKAAEGVTNVFGGKVAVAAGGTMTTAGEKPKVSSSGKVDESVSPTAPKIETTLEDGKTIKPSKLTFDVYAKDAAGKKINCKVTLNEEEVAVNWNDKAKVSYTLALKEGTNTVVITATADDETTKKTYTLYHKAIAEGDSVGHAVFTVEALTLGVGYLVEPTEIEIFEGENAAEALLRALDQYGFDYDYTGKPEKAFYLSHVKGVEGRIPMDLSSAPDCLTAVLEKDKAKIEARSDSDSLGEFDYTSMSGWMYSLNDVFPNVGFADTYLQDGDVVRVQFTVWGYGRDIGGADAMGSYGSNFYPVADKTELLRKVARRSYSSVSEKVKNILTSLDAAQSEVDDAL